PTATSRLYTLSLHDALPILAQLGELQLAEAGRLVCLPIRVEDRVTGVIKLAKGDASLLDPRAFSAMDVQFLSTLIAHVAYALEKDRKSTRLNSSHRTISYAV